MHRNFFDFKIQNVCQIQDGHNFSPELVAQKKVCGGGIYFFPEILKNA
jgi:hypothetical protein